MIFVTVGTQLAFDRLVEAVDTWAGCHAEQCVFAQIGPGAYAPQSIEYARFISPDECRTRMAEADAVVAHAGMGTILSALELGKPVLVMPRRAALGEHRNDHQLATVRRLSALGRVSVAADEHELPGAIDVITQVAETSPRIGPYASSELLDAVSRFITEPN